MILFRRIVCFIWLFMASVGVGVAQEAAHGFSLYGAPTLKAGFSHFPYANRHAPKGGAVRIAAIGHFDTLNGFNIKGTSAQGLGLIYDTLMVQSADEVGSTYGLLAKTVSHAPDFSWVSFSLRPAARFHDGVPLTAEDVVFSFNSLKAVHPGYAAYYGDITDVKAHGTYKVTFYAGTTGNRELPLILGDLPILPKHYWTANERDLAKTTLEPPLGSGAYQIANTVDERGIIRKTDSIIYERVPDYWAANINTKIGHDNFDRIRYDYFRDDTVGFEAFKAGEIDYRYEYNSRNWATGYDDAPAIRDGRIKRELIKLQNAHGMQGFVFNTRRAPFDDMRVREALNHAFDFEWTNEKLFYGQYARNNSFFDGSELAATGLPSKAELAYLNPLRAQLPEAVFTTPFQNPVTDGSGYMRTHLRHALALLQQAGWQSEAGKLMKDGAQMNIEFLIVQPAFERIVAPYAQNLKKLGIAAKIRIVDPSQYQNRVIGHDFDAIVFSFPQSLSPGNEQRNYWSSAAADRQGSRNFIGIKNPAIDALIEHIIFAKTRADVVAATRALDRVLLWNHYVVPQWYSPYERLAYWQGLRRPDTMPRYGLGFPSLWWRDTPPSYAPHMSDKGDKDQ